MLPLVQLNTSPSVDKRVLFIDRTTMKLGRFTVSIQIFLLFFIVLIVWLGFFQRDKYGLNPCGEGGEYETFTLDCPLFSKKIVM